MISVLLSTYNPDRARLDRTLSALFTQGTPENQWELIIVDNGSAPPLDGDNLGLSGKSNVRLVREERLGLIHARMTGLKTSNGDIVLFCDDDTVLASDYLAKTAEIFAADVKLGNAAGKSLPEYEIVPPDWIDEFRLCLALRDFSNQRQLVQGPVTTYPPFAFGGGGAAFRREALEIFEQSYDRAFEHLITGRSGKRLTSGEDNSLLLTVLAGGWRVGYFPELVLTHLIPASRLKVAYLGRLNRGIAKSWIEVLALHNICPWPPTTRWTLPLRKARAFLRNRAWRGGPQYIRWQGACGHFEGRAAISRIQRHRVPS